MADTADGLVARARSGDSAATEVLLREHAPRVLAVCRRLCADRGDADDAAQEAMIAIVRGLSRFDGRSSLSTWIYRVTTNCCMDELRRKRRRPEPVDTAAGSRPDTVEDQLVGTDPEFETVRSETRADLARALAGLPEDFRMAVVLRDVADLDYETISEITGVPIGTVRSRIARGRGRLADALGSGTDSPSHPSDRSEQR